MASAERAEGKDVIDAAFQNPFRAMLTAPLSADGNSSFKAMMGEGSVAMASAQKLVTSVFDGDRPATLV